MISANNKAVSVMAKGILKPYNIWGEFIYDYDERKI